MVLLTPTTTQLTPITDFSDFKLCLKRNHLLQDIAHGSTRALPSFLWPVIMKYVRYAVNPTRR
jgi:hypothetical protein